MPVIQHLIIDQIIFTSNDVVATISLEPVQHSVSINYRIDVINESDSFPLSEFNTSDSSIELNFLYNVNYTVTVIVPALQHYVNKEIPKSTLKVL